MLFKETSNSSEKCFLYVEKIQYIQGIEILSLLLLYLNIYFRGNDVWEGNSAFRVRTCYFFLELQPEYLLYWDSLYYSEHVRHVSFPVSAQEKSRVVMGGRKILLKSVVSTASLWPSLFWVTWTVSCDSSHVLSRDDCIHFICWFCILMSRYLCGLVLI